MKNIFFLLSDLTQYLNISTEWRKETTFKISGIQFNLIEIETHFNKNYIRADLEQRFSEIIEGIKWII